MTVLEEEKTVSEIFCESFLFLTMVMAEFSNLFIVPERWIEFKTQL